MTRERAVKLVETVIASHLCLGPDRYSMTSTLENLDADSLDLVEMILGLEMEAGIEILDDKVDSLRTVGDIVQMLETSY